MYAAQKEAQYVLSYSTMMVFTLFVIFFEYKAVKKYNPFGTYTPSSRNTRCGYHLVQGGQEFSIGFNMLTFFTPLRFQEYFPDAAQQGGLQLNQDGVTFGINYDPRSNG